MTTRWVRLEQTNDWGMVFLRLPGWGSTANQARQAVMFGETVTVRWPDGMVSSHAVVGEDHRERVSDHGHETIVDSRIPRVSVIGPPVNHGGLCLHTGQHLVSFNHVEVDLASLPHAPRPPA